MENPCGKTGFGFRSVFLYRAITHRPGAGSVRRRGRTVNDIRFRILTAVVLSFAAFASIYSALAAIAWWLVFTPRFRNLSRPAAIAGTVVMIAGISAALQLVQGTGVSYGIRMCAILLVAVWVWSEQQTGDYLSFGVWLLGRRIGFEAGMIAELAMQAFAGLLEDYDRLRIAWALKGQSSGIPRIPAAGLVLVRGTLRRAQDTAELLAVRGYRQGGSLCPEFRTGIADAAGCMAAFIAGSFAILPVGEFFILLH